MIVDSPKIVIGAIMKNPEILKFDPDHLYTKKMCKHAVKKLPFVMKYVPDRYRCQQIGDKSVPEDGGTLESV